MIRTCKESWNENFEKEMKQRRLIIYWKALRNIKCDNESEFKFDWEKRTRLKNDFITFRIDCRAFRTDYERKYYDIHNCCCDFRKK